MKRDKRMFRGTCEENARGNQLKLLSIAEKREGCRFLDVGCGDGKFTLEFGMKIGAKEMWGIDKYEPNIEEARKRGINVRKANLNEGMPFSSTFFDIVLCNQVAEHVLNPDNLFSEIDRVLKVGGKCYISVPNLCAMHSRIFVLLGWQPTCIWPSTKFVFGNPARGWQLSGVAEYKHVNAFSPAAFKEMLEFYGFEVKKYYGSGFYPFRGRISSVMSRLLPTFSVIQIVKAVKGGAKRKWSKY